MPATSTRVHATPCDEQTADAKRATQSAQMQSGLRRVEVEFVYPKHEAHPSKESLANGVDPRLWMSHANTRRLVEKLRDSAPPYLLHHVHEFPASWFKYLASFRQAELAKWYKYRDELRRRRRELKIRKPPRPLPRQ